MILLPCIWKHRMNARIIMICQKTAGIEWLDSRIIAPIVERLESKEIDFRMLILSDHKTLMESLQHDGDPVPYILYDSTTDTGAD